MQGNPLNMFALVLLKKNRACASAQLPVIDINFIFLSSCHWSSSVSLSHELSTQHSSPSGRHYKMNSWWPQRSRIPRSAGSDSSVSTAQMWRNNRQWVPHMWLPNQKGGNVDITPRFRWWAQGIHSSSVCMLFASLPWCKLVQLYPFELQTTCLFDHLQILVITNFRITAGAVTWKWLRQDFCTSSPS